jgi:protease IV
MTIRKQAVSACLTIKQVLHGRLKSPLQVLGECMKNLTLALLILLLIASVASAQQLNVPPYYTVSEFMATTPSVEGGAVGGLFNPAVWGLTGRPELQFLMNDVKNLQPIPRNTTLGIDLGGLGFSMQHWKWTDYSDVLNPQSRSFNDFQVGLGFGDKANRFGFSYGWSKGDISSSDLRSNILTLGYMSRPDPHLSYGVAWTTALNSSHDGRGIVDVGVRPLGTPLVTLFGDASMMSNDKFKDILWAAGASVEPIPGIALQFKAIEGGAYQAGLALTVGGLGLSATPRYDKSGTRAYNTYGIRLGPPQDDFLSKKVMKGKQFYNLTFDGPIKYQRYKLFDMGGHTLTELLDNLDYAKNDPHVGGLAIKITEDMSASWEVLWEVREKIKDVKASGKKVVVFLERGDMPEYYLASVADKIMVDPETTVSLMGFSLGKTYYKNLLDKIGIGFEEWRFFKYKSAEESFARTNMSEGDREQLTALANGFYETFRKDICESRGLTNEQFDHVINDIGILTADSLMTYKLADTTGRWDSIEDYIKKIEGSSKTMIGTQRLAMMQPVSRIWGEPPQIAVIYALGPCAMNSGINARRLEGVIKSARENKRIKAVVLRADSPGGDILPSDIVAVEIKKTAEKKPVIISQGWVAASGGYWISMNGQKIVASPWTITGSIGVIGGWAWDKGLGDKLGLSYDHTQVGTHADLGRGWALPLIGQEIPNRNLTDDEHARMQKQILLWYDTFLTKVAAGRKMDKDKVAEIAQGRVWTGTAGKENGLVDELGGLEKAIALAKDAAKIKPGSEVKVTEMPDKGLFDPAMFQPKLLGIKLGSVEDSPELTYIRMILQADGKPLAMLPPEFMLGE